MSATLRVGTDCSGIEAPIQALMQLSIPFTHVFSSEIDEDCIKSISANYHPQIIYKDMTKRNLAEVPDIDLYVCGFPCQTFSTAGRRDGFDDLRGTIFFHCLELIQNKQPKYFILENVKGLLSHDGGKSWSTIWTALSSLTEYSYHIDWRLLNTKDYGIPQNRERVYIVGSKVGNISWPDVLPVEDIHSYVDITDNRKVQCKTMIRYGARISEDAVFINTDFLKYTSFPSANVLCPCIGAQSTLWCHNVGRYANVTEYLKLQGFTTDFKRVVSNTSLKRQIGNSMSVNVVNEILKRLLWSE